MGLPFHGCAKHLQGVAGCMLRGSVFQDLPRVIRKSDRRYEIIVQEASVWKKLG